MPKTNIDELSDAALLQRLSRSPSERVKLSIWEELYVRHRNYAYVTISSTFSPDEIVEVGDILNDVFLQFFEQLDAKKIIRRIRHPSKTSQYLRGMLRNIIRDRKRKLSKEPPFVRRGLLNEEAWDKILRAGTVGERGFEQKWDEDTLLFIRFALKKHLGALDEKSGRILSARIERDPLLGYKAIAEELGITESSARQRYRRGLAKFRAEIVKEAEKCLGKGLWDDGMLKRLIKELK